MAREYKLQGMNGALAGLFVTDWGASVDRVPGLEAGTDLEMPSSGTLNSEKNYCCCCRKWRS